MGADATSTAAPEVQAEQAMPVQPENAPPEQIQPPPPLPTEGMTDMPKKKFLALQDTGSFRSSFDEAANAIGLPPDLRAEVESDSYDETRRRIIERIGRTNVEGKFEDNTATVGVLKNLLAELELANVRDTQKAGEPPPVIDEKFIQNLHFHQI